MFISNVFLKSAAVVSRFTLCKYLAITMVSEDYNTGYRTTIGSFYYTQDRAGFAIKKIYGPQLIYISLVISLWKHIHLS